MHCSCRPQNAFSGSAPVRHLSGRPKQKRAKPSLPLSSYTTSYISASPHTKCSMAVGMPADTAAQASMGVPE